MIDILHRRTGAVVYHSETAQTIAEAVLECQKRASEAGGRAYLQGADLRSADLQGANLRGAYLQRADLRGAYLQCVDLHCADLRRADLHCVDLRRADLQCADLRGAYLQRAYLQCADLRGAYLQGADLHCADLQGADLRGADLQDAYFQRVDFRGADLQGAVGLLPNGIPPLQIGGSRHWIIVRQPGYITIGCHHQTVAWWEEHYAATGRAEHYTAEQVEEYRRHIAYCREWMEAHSILAVHSRG